MHVLHGSTSVTYNIHPSSSSGEQPPEILKPTQLSQLNSFIKEATLRTTKLSDLEAAGIPPPTTPDDGSKSAGGKKVTKVKLEPSGTDVGRFNMLEGQGSAHNKVRLQSRFPDQRLVSHI